MEILGHRQGSAAINGMLEATVLGGYTRVCRFNPSLPAVMWDEVPAKGYVPNAPGGVDFMGNGSRVHVVYITKPKDRRPSPKEEEEMRLRCGKAVKSGYLYNELVGTLVSIRRCANGNVQLLLVAANRDKVVDGAIVPGEIAIESLSISDIPGQGGRIVALGLDQHLALRKDQMELLIAEELRAMAAEVAAYEAAHPEVVEKRMATEARRRAKASKDAAPNHTQPAPTPTPTEAPAEAQQDPRPGAGE